MMFETFGEQVKKALALVRDRAGINLELLGLNLADSAELMTVSADEIMNRQKVLYIPRESDIMSALRDVARKQS